MNVDICQEELFWKKDNSEIQEKYKTLYIDFMILLFVKKDILNSKKFFKIF